MKYVLELNFKDKPECNTCILARHTGRNLDGETFAQCQALMLTSKCPFMGCRSDCPLKEAKE